MLSGFVPLCAQLDGVSPRINSMHTAIVRRAARPEKQSVASFIISLISIRSFGEKHLPSWSLLETTRDRRLLNSASTGQIMLQVVFWKSYRVCGRELDEREVVAHRCNSGQDPLD